MKMAKAIMVGATVAAVVALVYMWGNIDGRSGKNALAVSSAGAAEPTASPVKALPEQEVYYPGTENLAPDEMRVVACGTGMPNSRPKQAAACFLVELGNGDKFIFDIGSGSAERLSAMKIPYDFLDKGLHRAPSLGSLRCLG